MIDSRPVSEMTDEQIRLEWERLALMNTSAATPEDRARLRVLDDEGFRRKYTKTPVN